MATTTEQFCYLLTPRALLLELPVQEAPEAREAMAQQVLWEPAAMEAMAALVARLLQEAPVVLLMAEVLPV